MIIALTGTPGVGKHTVASYLAKQTGYKIIDLNLLLRKKHIKEISISQLNKIVSPLIEEDSIIVSHMAHLLKSNKIDLFVVLRCNPIILIKRLKKRGYSSSKIRDNVIFEILDGEYIEAVEAHKNVAQIDNSSDYVRASKLIIKYLKGGRIIGDPIDFSVYMPRVLNILGKI